MNRPPYSTIASLPPEVRDNGYVQDLVNTIRNAASELGRPIAFNAKNGRMYIVVAIPTADELREMDERVEREATCA